MDDIKKIMDEKKFEEYKPWDFVHQDGEIHADYLKGVWSQRGDYPSTILANWRTKPWMVGDEGETVLDVGCGHAAFYKYFTDYRKMNYVGLDYSDRMLEICRENYPQVEFIQGRLPLSLEDDVQLPIEDKQFDLVFCYEVLRHLPTSEAAIHELLRISKKYTVISLFNSPNYNKRIYFSYSHGAVERNELVSEAEGMVAEIAQNYDIKWNSYIDYQHVDGRINYCYIFHH